MTNVRASSARRAAAVSLLAFSLVGVSACSTINAQETTKQYAASDGSAITVGHKGTTVDFRNILIVTNAKGKPGRILGSVVNNGSEPVTVSFTVNGSEVGRRLTVPSGDKGSTSLTDEKNLVELSSTPVVPGREVTVTVTAGDDQREASVPVLDGTLPQYRQYIPGGYTPAPTPSSSPKGEGAAEH